ncbi:ATP-grasp domain-containing protein [Serinicoccus kebangsaanensis]|uniref:ATP-grasp domain-containing protein n=1 Tax=Serinicoccus kebangsaanensis TaxID=2602069 RepID=UPI00124F5CED|nr:ATP-grasp domain-containing protein [Serinicoccus kebangsaanensis]
MTGGGAERPVVLVTGAGGAAAVTLLEALAEDYTVAAADLDPLAVGLYLVPEERRGLLPRGEDESFVDELLDLARRVGAGLVIPTVDVELLAVAAARGRFADHGIEVLVERTETLMTCLDKHVLMQHCADHVRVPRTVLWGEQATAEQVRDLGEPLIVKPRRGAGGRGFEVLPDAQALRRLPRDGTVIAQELLPGEEFSIDVLGRPEGGEPVAAVPRRRDKVDSGIAVAGRTVADPELVEIGRAVARAIGVVGVVNVQVRRAVDGTPALLEVNPRFPGTMSLTRAAGVDMPRLAVGAVLGRTLPERLDFTEVAVVRHWADVVVPVADYPFAPEARTS